MASSSVPIVKPYDITQIEIQADLTKWLVVSSNYLYLSMHHNLY